MPGYDQGPNDLRLAYSIGQCSDLSEYSVLPAEQGRIHQLYQTATITKGRTRICNVERLLQ